MLDDVKEKLYAKFLQFLVFSILGTAVYCLMVFVVSWTTVLLGVPLGPNFVGISAALLAGSMILAGAMPTDN